MFEVALLQVTHRLVEQNWRQKVHDESGICNRWKATPAREGRRRGELLQRLRRKSFCFNSCQCSLLMSFDFYTLFCTFLSDMTWLRGDGRCLTDSNSKLAHRCFSPSEETFTNEVTRYDVTQMSLCLRGLELS